MEPPTSSLSQANIEYQLRNIQRYNPDVQFVDPEHFEIAIDPTTWTEFETKERRRIIEFTAVFDFKPTFIPQVIVHWRPIDPSQYQSSRPNSHSISVILDEGRAVLTSVDIISSAETFFATRFCTGEKNRIRRGFESSGPNTLHKGGSELYSCIQGFNNPKPRNIDKSVKVFPAVVFRSLIEKICSNYVSTTSSSISLTPDCYCGHAVQE
ncbi:hypothetical protein CspeluHIS016_0603230 [Cutaneotrichosporon spelunceum]|uniref:DUF7082 domain-containing protein n=1 Tax=Cutaneotrichosporon spelunceum TaxID=1672016 RepID=A0AAD3YD92_9TREE|nr:hypothetical protein CspeluHIS016_0603230 [Cutaneotrichosporon spelunceum]